MQAVSNTVALPSVALRTYNFYRLKTRCNRLNSKPFSCFCNSVAAIPPSADTLDKPRAPSTGRLLVTRRSLALVCVVRVSLVLNVEDAVLLYASDGKDARGGLDPLSLLGNASDGVDEVAAESLDMAVRLELAL